MTDCGLVSGDPRFHGSYLSNGECIARNGKDNANGVRAFAHCVNNDYTCTYHEGPKSDIISTVGCTDDDQLMISCLPHNNIGAIHGAYVGTQFENTTIDSDTLCTAHHEQDGHGGWAKGICCKYNGNDGYQLDCKTNWGPKVYSGESSVYCDSPYWVWGCSGYSNFKDSLAEYNHVASRCWAESVFHSVWAVATCCRLYKQPTPLPTQNPTKSPTSGPTSLTTNPTSLPTLEPSNVPTTPPTIDTADPTINPTTDNPTNAPSLEPSTTPTDGEDDVVTIYESTAYEHSSGEKGDTKASNLNGVYIAMGVVVSVICIGVIIYKFVTWGNKRLPTDSNPRASSVDEIRPPGTGTMCAEEKSEELDSVVSDVVLMVKDNDGGSRSSDSLYDAAHNQVGTYQTPTVGENKMPSVPLPELPREASKMPSIPLSESSQNDEGRDPDALYAKGHTKQTN
eukprot:978460_1